MAERRKPISKKMRFEVFKRDSFKCQYCGRSAPDVILECDHINPVSKGGANDLVNLITSCFDCNRGKGKTRISDNQTIAKQKAELDELNMRREQMKMMVEWREELSYLLDSQVDAIEQIFVDACGDGFTDFGRQGIKKYIRRFGFEEVFISAQIAVDRYMINNTEWEFKRAFNKIGGICYNRKNGRTWGGD